MDESTRRHNAMVTLARYRQNQAGLMQFLSEAFDTAINQCAEDRRPVNSHMIKHELIARFVAGIERFARAHLEETSTPLAELEASERSDILQLAVDALADALENHVRLFGVRHETNPADEEADHDDSPARTEQNAFANMQVFDLRAQQTFFETSANGFPLGTRSFKLWSCGPCCTRPHQTPREGDLIVIARERNWVLYQIIGSPSRLFRGSDGNEYWKGMMRDVIHHDAVTQQMVDVLKPFGLA